MHEPPLSKSLIDDPALYTLTLLVSRRMVYASATAPGRAAVLSAIPADITAPSMAAALREVVYANPMLLLPYSKVAVMIDVREYFWLPAELASQAEDAARVMGFDDEKARQCVTVATDGLNSLAMLAESALVNFIRRTFPEATISHPAAVMVKYLRRRQSTSSTGAVHVDLGQDSMTVAVFDSAGLALCGTYRPTGVQSQTYYAVAASNTAGVHPADAEMFVSGSPDARAALMASLSRFSHHVMPAIVPTAAYPELTDIASVPYPLLISPLCE